MIETLTLDSSEMCRLNTCHNLWMILSILKMLGLAGTEGEMDEWVQDTRRKNVSVIPLFKLDLMYIILQ